jgi:hypothetical protein
MELPKWMASNTLIVAALLNAPGTDKEDPILTKDLTLRADPKFMN